MNIWRRFALSLLWLCALGWLSSAGVMVAEEVPEGMQPKSWKKAVLARLVLPAKAQQEQAKGRVRSSIIAVERQLAALPNGARLAKEMDLVGLSAAVAQPEADAAYLREKETSLQATWPAGIQAAVNKLRHDISFLSGYAALSEERLESARTHTDQLATVWEKGFRSSDDGASLRQSYGNLATTHLVDDLLPALRERISRANVQVLVARQYVASVGTRRFAVPVQFAQQVDQGSVAVTGSLRFEVFPHLLNSTDAASLQLVVRAVGQGTVRGRRDQVAATATSHVNANAIQTVNFNSNGVHAPPVALRVGSSTSLESLNLGIRCRLGSRLATRFANRIAADRLAAADPRIAAQIQQQTTTRVDDECADVAYRINGLLRIALADQLFARDLSANSHFATDRYGIWSTAEFRHHDQLGAIAPAPQLPTEIALSNEIAFWMQESALNNVSESLAGRRLDETTFLEMIQEEFKLGSEFIERLPQPRIAAAIVFADRHPLRVAFAKQGLELVLNLESFEADGEVVGRRKSEVHARYQITRTETGIRLLRTGPLEAVAHPALDSQSLAVLERFLPESFDSLPRYRNASFSHFMQLQYLELTNGWLVASARCEQDTAPRVSARAERRTKQ